MPSESDMQSVFVGLNRPALAGRHACRCRGVAFSVMRRLFCDSWRGPAAPACRTGDGFTRGLSARGRNRRAAGSSGAHGDRGEARCRRDGLLHRPHPGGERNPPGLSHIRTDGRTPDQCRRSRRAGTGGGQAGAAGRAQCLAHRAGRRCGGTGTIEPGAEQLRSSENAAGQRHCLARAVRAGRSRR